MCGIAGAFAYRGDGRVDRDELVRVRDAMAQRGPDGHGLWISDSARIGLAHRRLAIIDLSDAGAQPMATPDGLLRITYNGEIYNYRELRRDLERKGVVFRTNSDTEVLLHLYADRREGMLGALRGMFAFAIWDESNRRLFLARDPFGIKPLYYADDGSTLRFASQVRALIAARTIDLTPDAAGAAGFLLWGSVPEPFTLYRSIKSLPAGSWMSVDGDVAIEPRRYFDIAAEFRDAAERGRKLRERDVRDQLSAALDGTVASHLIADVPVSVFLSAGIDSSLIATLAARQRSSELHCVTLGFDEYKATANDETALAAETARRLGARHDVEWIDRKTFFDQIADVMASMDQPSIDGVNTYFVARAAARQKLKVALSGLGGDEILLGYPSFRDVPRMARTFAFANHLPSFSARAFRSMAAPVLRQFTSPKYAGLLEYGGTHEGAYLLRRGLFMPSELPSLLGPAVAREGVERLDTLKRLRSSREGVREDSSITSSLELSWYMRNQLLRDADWAGMAHSLEIRVPFVDVEVLRAVAPLTAAGLLGSKRDAAAMAAPELSPAVLNREKTGFTVPTREWLSEITPARRAERGLRGWARRVLRYFTKRRSVLGLVTDAFGGHGGIALYGRDFLSATCSDPKTDRVVVLPRLARNPIEQLPSKLLFDTSGLHGKARYMRAVLRTLRSGERFDMVICGHVNILPLAIPVAALLRVPLVLLIYGIDAWVPARRWPARFLARRADAYVSISETTLSRFRAWTGVPADKCVVLPNAIHLSEYGPGPRNEVLAARYGLTGRVVIMTLGRLAATERYKGVDEVLDIMPRLIERVPNLTYLIAGDGSDRPRLESKADALGLATHVVFTGEIKESEKADHYRLADAFVMPSSGEGFGFVFLEAMACGVPVVGSRIDGSREALRDGSLGQLVDPSRADELEAAILKAVREPKRVPAGIEYFDFENFERRCHRLMTRTLVLAG